MVVLKNDRITLHIAEKGAEIRKMTLDGKDVLWSGDPAYWAGVAPVMFPFCGGLRDDTYTYEGKAYTMPKHGYLRFMDFTVEREGYGFVTFLHTSNEDTKKQYPWDYALRITYTLCGTKLDITYDVKNLSDSIMLFAIGSHEAYACPEGIEQYDVIFPERETLEACVLDGSLLKHETATVLKDGNVLPLYEKYFEIDALVFKGMKSKSCTLRNRVTGREVRVDFPGNPYFLLWQVHGAPYICLEPWGGIPSYNDEAQDLAKKEGITRLGAGETFTRTHTITV